MATITKSEVLQDELAISFATVMALANRKATELGVNPLESRISTRQIFEDGITIWKINYGPKEYINRRGGDLLIEIDSSRTEIRRVLRGQ